jgi:hypothetical protein
LTLRQNESPGYAALSYVWGSEDDPSHIEVISAQQKGVLAATHNLVVALRHLRQKKKLRRMWIDALCINQSDVEEKNIQVATMGRIYKSADRVISWLGPAHDNSDDAIALLRMIGPLVDIDLRLGEMSPSNESIRALRRTGFWTRSAKKRQREEAAKWGVSESVCTWTTEEYECVNSLFQRPYFERAWILQEIRLAKDILFQCGNATIVEDDLWQSVLCLRLKAHNKSRIPYQLSEWNLALKLVIYIAQLRL